MPIIQYHIFILEPLGNTYVKFQVIWTEINNLNIHRSTPCQSSSSIAWGQPLQRLKNYKYTHCEALLPWIHVYISTILIWKHFLGHICIIFQQYLWYKLEIWDSLQQPFWFVLKLVSKDEHCHPHCDHVTKIGITWPKLDWTHLDICK